MEDKKREKQSEVVNRPERKVCRYREVAERGDASSQCKLGCCYQHGYGVEKNEVEAVKWYRKAAEQGNMVAQNALGECYYYGQGVVQDFVEAFKWCRMAAEQGLARAQFNLGQMYDNGRCVDKNDVEALKWYRKAAEQGHGEAHGILAQRMRGGIREVIHGAASVTCLYSSTDDQDDHAGTVCCNLPHVHRDAESLKERHSLLACDCPDDLEERWREEEGWLEVRRKREKSIRFAKESVRREDIGYNRQLAVMKILGSARNVSGFIGSRVVNFIVTPFIACVSAFVSLFSRFQRAPRQKVVTSAFAPSQARRNSDLLVSVFLHTLAEAEAVQRLARKIQKNSERCSYKPLACQLKDGDKVDILLNIYGGNELLSSQTKSIVWWGRYDDSTFRYFIPEDIHLDEISCEVNLSMNNVPMGEMIFKVEIGAYESHTPAEFDSRVYNKIFISYSHEDESKVKYIANAYKLEEKDYFFDRHYLRSGDVYPEEIRNFINTSDLFILCWSANASKSEYVRKELLQALNLAYPKIQPREKARLAIRPISIDPRADPPDEMKDVYNFEDV